MVNSYALRPAWTPLTIFLMVLGFIVFWPLGLAMLAYIIWGDRMPEVKQHFEGMKRNFKSEFRGCSDRARGHARTGMVSTGA
ncbi:MAG: DUF2852 domain-containing protein, partial [Bauldia litoralis]|uniref:DUF2852 domain-containing protein n=1 Tax=Bauldia litoralis TaxID=665467 RepID=UPI003298C973